MDRRTTETRTSIFGWSHGTICTKRRARRCHNGTVSYMSSLPRIIWHMSYSCRRASPVATNDDNALGYVGKLFILISKEADILLCKGLDFDLKHNEQASQSIVRGYEDWFRLGVCDALMWMKTKAESIMEISERCRYQFLITFVHTLCFIRQRSP